MTRQLNLMNEYRKDGLCSCGCGKKLAKRSKWYSKDCLLVRRVKAANRRKSKVAQP